MTVVRLGAWCDLDAEDEHARTVSFAVSEFAVLADGRRLTLHSERGFSLSTNTGDPWRFLTAESIERDVLTTVLPDEDDPQEEHPWEWLAGLARALGVEASPDELRLLPYDVVLSERLRARLA